MYIYLNAAQAAQTRDERKKMYDGKYEFLA